MFDQIYVCMSMDYRIKSLKLTTMNNEYFLAELCDNQQNRWSTHLYLSRVSLVKTRQ
jgi:hypothetical protein